MRGGKRNGAGRKAKEGARVSITFRLPLDALELLNREAERTGESRTKILAELIRDKFVDTEKMTTFDTTT